MRRFTRRPALISLTRRINPAAQSFNLFDAACADANFMDGVVSGVYTEIENFLSSNSVAIGGGLAAAIASRARANDPGVGTLVCCAAGVPRDFPQFVA